jgi:hypothetical protein
MTNIRDIAVRIIQEQELVIGPLAWSEAEKTQGIRVINRASSQIEIDGDGAGAVDRLVAKYERLFGRASHEVCREAAAPLLVGMPEAEIPSSLR